MMIKYLCAVALIGNLAVAAAAGPVFGAASYTSTLTLHSASGYFIPTSITFAQGNYYGGYGGGTNSPFVKYDSAGNILASVRPAPGMEFRSLFSDTAGHVFARDYQVNYIYKETSFGSFVIYQQLTGPFDTQGQVVLDSSGTHYVGNNKGTLQFWDLAGNKTSSVVLAAGAPTGVVSIFGDYAISYTSTGLNAYDLTTGALVDTTQLAGATPSQYSFHYGQGYANGYFFLTNTDGSYSGFQIGPPPSAVPEPMTWALLITGFGVVGTAARRRRTALAD